jgi:hypothetical protein
VQNDSSSFLHTAYTEYKYCEENLTQQLHTVSSSLTEELTIFWKDKDAFYSADYENPVLRGTKKPASSVLGYMNEIVLEHGAEQPEMVQKYNLYKNLSSKISSLTLFENTDTLKSQYVIMLSKNGYKLTDTDLAVIADLEKKCIVRVRVRVLDDEDNHEPLMKFGNFENYENLILIQCKNEHYERIQCDMTETIMDFNTGTTFVEFLTSDQHSYCV